MPCAHLLPATAASIVRKCVVMFHSACCSGSSAASCATTNHSRLSLVMSRKRWGTHMPGELLAWAPLRPTWPPAQAAIGYEVKRIAITRHDRAMLNRSGSGFRYDKMRRHTRSSKSDSPICWYPTHPLVTLAALLGLLAMADAVGVPCRSLVRRPCGETGHSMESRPRTDVWRVWPWRTLVVPGGELTKQLGSMLRSGSSSLLLLCLIAGAAPHCASGAADFDKAAQGAAHCLFA